MYSVLAGTLTAKFNPDGRHLNRYLARRELVARSVCENLVLHDRLLIPTNDYLTACGLTLILGEDNFIDLLETGQVTFLRLRDTLGYVRGEGRDGTLVCMVDPNERRPHSSPIEESVRAGLEVISGKIRERQKLQSLITRQSVSLESRELLDVVTRDSIADLRQTSLWKDEYELSDPNLVALPGVKKMQVRILGENTGQDPDDIVNALLSIAFCNIELTLSQRFNCESICSALQLGSLVDLKARRLMSQATPFDKLWSLCEVNGVPDLGTFDPAEGIKFQQFLKVVRKKNACDFRKWFHDRQVVDPLQIVKEYVEVLNQIPWTQTTSVRILRFLVTSLAGIVPPVGLAASLLDTFLVDRLLKGSSPKFFIEDLQVSSEIWKSCRQRRS